MEGIQLFLLILQIIIAVLLVTLVLVQKSDGDSLSGLGSGSGGLNSAISGRSSMSILSKTTMSLVALFMINCLVLATISNNSQKQIQEELNKVAEEQYKNNPVETNNKPTIPDIK